MSFAEFLVGVAVDLSPEEYRQIRREQWSADIRDAAECDLDPRRLAFGAVTTSLFHRMRAPRHFRKESRMTATNTSRSTVSTASVLLLAVVSSILLSALFTLAFGGRHGGGSWQWYRFVAIQVAFTTLLPSIGVILIMRAIKVPRTRVILAGAVLLAASVGFGGWELWPYVGIGHVDYTYTLAPTFWGLPTLGLVAWLWATDARGWRWASITAPFAVWAVMLPLASSLPVNLLPTLERLPLLAGIAVGALALSWNLLRSVRVTRA